MPAEAVVATSEDVDEDLAARLEAAMLAKKSYRTRHLRSDGKPKFTNRLVLEASPYLQQHAHNPVDWYPWGDEAFETAKRLGRPVLLSIGYSTCHWCHVMEEESFEDLEVAKVLNDNYIAIKVDREERPDVDSTYMAAVQRIAGRGGWPMTMWLTPERTPFFGGTYFPPRAGVRGSRKGFTELLQEWSGRYRDDPQGTVQAAQELASEVARGADVDRSGKIGNRTRALDLAVRAFQRSYDAQNHGWGRQKFPMPSRLRFLLRAATYEEDTGALKMVTQTLDAMAHGGIFDHVAGGFHRYTVDPNWRTPHFEKMLYDNAALITTYTEAWQLTKSPLYAEVVRRCVEYLLREMRNGAGAFYAATDADSEGEEGTYFVWTPAQVDEAAPRHAKLLKLYFGIVKNGPFEGSNVLHVAVPAAQAAKQLGLSLPQFKQELEEGVAALLKVRQTRVPPHRDDKILTAWNGLMIEALAKAGFAFSRPEWVAAGEAAAAGLPVVEGKLRRSATNGQPGPKAFAVDHAFVVAGLLALFEASGNPAHLRRAIVVQKQQDASFWDAKRGGYYLNSAEAASELLVRERPFRDGAIASPNSVSLLNLAKLSALLDDAKLLERRDALEHAFGRSLQNQGASAPQMLVGVDWLAGDPKEVAIVGDDAEALLKVLRTGFYPHHVLARPTSASVVPWLEGKVAREGRATAYVCRNYACKLPTTDAAVFSKQLRAP